MSEAWKQLDLEGEGLQSANLRLVRLMKKRTRAYGLLVLFPLGLHRAYLEEMRGAWLYRALSVTTVLAVMLEHGWIALILGGFVTSFLLYDIRWIEDRVALLNKKLRMTVYKSKRTAAAPKDFRGRYVDDNLDDYFKLKEQERGGHVLPGKDPALNSRSRAPSFAEQEAMLKALSASRKNDKSG